MIPGLHRPVSHADALVDDPPSFRQPVVDQLRPQSSGRSLGMAAGARNRDHSPQEAMEVSVFGLLAHRLQFTKQTRHEGEVPEGTYIFQREKKRLNYIFQRHRHAEEYQQCLGPEAEMPKMRIWKINTVELGIVAFFFFLGLLKAREVNTAAGKTDKAGVMENLSLSPAFCCRNGLST